MMHRRFRHHWMGGGLGGRYTCKNKLTISYPTIFIRGRVRRNSLLMGNQCKARVVLIYSPSTHGYPLMDKFCEQTRTAANALIELTI